MNLGKCGSWDIYSIEYKWTKDETKVTTQHIETVKLSNINPQSTFSTSESIQLVNLIYVQQPIKATS